MIQFFPDPRTLLSIGPFAIRWYALTFLGGALLTYWFMKKDIKADGYPADTADDLFVGCLFSGIVAARIWYCLFSDPAYYFGNPVHLLEIYKGGIGIQGGILGGLAYAYFYCRRHKISLLRMCDAVMGNMLIAQAVGRWGNFINQEAYGRQVSEAWYSGWPSFLKNGMYIDGAYRQPTFLWESALDLAGFLIIRYAYRRFYKDKKRGDLTALYLLWYGLSRFLVEGFRTDNLMIGSLRMSRIMGLLSAAAGLGLYIWLHSRKTVRKPVVLFDLDGTLLDTEPAIIESYKCLFRKYRREEDFTPELQVEVLGPSLEQEMKKFFPDQDPQKLIEEYRTENRRIHPDTVKPMANAKETVEWLRGQGCKTGIVSTKASEMVKYGLELNGMDKDFDVIVGHEMVKVEKPDPEGIRKACAAIGRGQDELIYVGDSASDVKAGVNAGAYTVAYVSKEEKRQALLDAKPNAVITDLLAVKEMLEKEDHSWTRTMM